MTDHKMTIDYAGFHLTSIEFPGRWCVTITSTFPKLAALVPQNSTTSAASKDEAFALARGVVDATLRSRSRPT